MKILRWSIISSLLFTVVIMVACQSNNTSIDANSKVETEQSIETQSPLKEKISRFYSLFDHFPEAELTCDDMQSKTSIGKEMVIEYIDSDVREWSDEEWKEISYNTVFAIKEKNYYLFAIEREGPGSSEIMLNTYDLNGILKSSIPICKDSPTGDLKSRIATDRSIFRMDDSGVSTYRINPRGNYIKGE